MITVTRTAAIAPGKTSDAIAFADQIAKHIQVKYGTKLNVLMPIGGNPGRITWRSDYDSLAQWETFTAKLIADTDYMGAIAKHSASFLPGSVHDEIWRTI